MNYEIREDRDGNVYVKDLALISVSSYDEVIAVINQGLKLRATHETKMNAVSSRSHTVFTITVVQRDRATGEAVSGKLNLVDLAGSERIKKSESTGIRMKEALHINTSLTALGKVVMSLDPSAGASHVPYRDSKLTRLLQNSLGGNSYTTVIATVHPVRKYMEECLSTLQFANRCRNVQNMPRVNYLSDATGGDPQKRIKKLLEEIAALRQQLAVAKAGGRKRGGGGKRARRRRGGGGEGGEGDDDDGATGVDYDDSGYDDDDGGGGAGGLDNLDVLKILEEVRTARALYYPSRGRRERERERERARAILAGWSLSDSSEHALSIRRFHAPLLRRASSARAS